MANPVYTFDLQNIYLNNDDPWAGILEVKSFMVQSTYQNMLQATPGQLKFRCYMILNNPFITDWGYIRTH